MFRVKFYGLDGKPFCSTVFDRYEQANHLLCKMVDAGHNTVFTGSQIEFAMEGKWYVASEPEDFEPHYCSKCDVYASPDCWCGALTGFATGPVG